MMYLFIIVCFCVFLFCGESTLMSMGVSVAHEAGCLTYHFSHASWLHLIINILSLGIMYKPICKIWQRKYPNHAHVGVRIFIGSYIGATIAGLMSAASTPTVGASGIVFFHLGVLLLLNPTKRQALNYLWIVAMFAMQFILGKSNVMLHIIAFVLGALYIIGIEFIKNYDEYRGNPEYQR